MDVLIRGDVPCSRLSVTSNRSWETVKN